MKDLNYNKKKKNNSIVTAATFLTLATITITLLVGTAVTIAPLASLQSASAQRFIDSESNFAVERKLAPAVVSGDNIYIAWWTNNTENKNEEVMFRASNDGGATFSNKTNLSNTPNADSWRVEIAGEGDNVVVSWWETNQTSDTPVARISNDAGQTFGPLLRLATNGTISSSTETTTTTAAGGETVEEEAAGGAEVAE
jgi:predicted membrane-bound mannosyltransferase